ncbi:MAG: AAA family ATPase, partial [Actinomycetota bacterium]|nr:AAA family ATPase [Actinomycetota bacterium]
MSLLYRRLDAMRSAAAAALAESARAPTAGTPAARTERDAFVELYARRVRQLQSVEQRLCFGRLDLIDGPPRYVGRIGISDDDRRELMVDWRAPAAEAFYQATAAHPRDVVRRRQIATRDRGVTGVSDEVLDIERFDAVGVGGSRVVIGEGALLASLELARTGHMRDIVATIQADQDRVIRAPADGVLVVQGGPGTGKTAVALHRAAFLLYARRERLERTGVLVVGPNRRFLRYIDQVLPTLGEAEAVVMRTSGELYPGVAATGQDGPALAVLKGDVRMAEVLREAVRRRQRVPERSRRLDVDGATVVLRPSDVRAAREHARRS